MRFKPAVLPFVVGLLLGTLICAMVQRPLLRHFGWGHRRPDAGQIAGKLSSDLSLTADQKAKVQKILDDSFQRMNVLRDQVHPQFKAIREDARKAIREVLEPGQQARFDEISEKQDRRMEKMKEKFGDR